MPTGEVRYQITQLAVPHFDAHIVAPADDKVVSERHAPHEIPMLRAGPQPCM
jgi:hypothetical protein